MFDEPIESPKESASDPAQRARERADEFRMHAELAAVFEGSRKFDAELRPNFRPEWARDIQQTMARLEKAKIANTPVVDKPAMAQAKRILSFPSRRKTLSTNDYHIYRRPGEVMIVRWLAGEQVETYYQRLQAHFDAALEGHKEDERQAHGWKQDEKAAGYLAALDEIKVDMGERYLRPLIRESGIAVLSTQTADELNIQYLCDYVMGVKPADLVGEASAPPVDPTERDLAWFFKLFSLRSASKQTERMCYFAFLQKTDDAF